MIRLHRQWWDACWPREWMNLDAERAERWLRERGADVCLVDGNPDIPCTADTDAERQAVADFHAEMRETWHVGALCGTALMHGLYGPGRSTTGEERSRVPGESTGTKAGTRRRLRHYPGRKSLVHQ